MPLKKLPYKTLDELIKKRLTVEEDKKTAELIKLLKQVRKRKWLSKDELELICRWKSPRAIHHIRVNHPLKVKAVTNKAFTTKSEKIKLELLTSLRGVSIPMASAVLMLTDPKRYGVIDIRVWEVLFSLKTVNTKEKGVNFRFQEWYRMLKIFRSFSKKYKASVRNIEYSIFLVHQEYQKGNLYQIT